MDSSFPLVVFSLLLFPQHACQDARISFPPQSPQCLPRCHLSQRLASVQSTTGILATQTSSSARRTASEPIPSSSEFERSPR